MLKNEMAGSLALACWILFAWPPAQRATAKLVSATQHRPRNRWRKLPACGPYNSQAGSLRHGRCDSNCSADAYLGTHARLSDVTIAQDGTIYGAGAGSNSVPFGANVNFTGFDAAVSPRTTTNSASVASASGSSGILTRTPKSYQP